jgi:hypothetical protein
MFLISLVLGNLIRRDLVSVAQDDALQPIYSSPDIMNVKWSTDSQFLVFGLAENDVRSSTGDWLRYDVSTEETQRSNRWYLQPRLRPGEEALFQPYDRTFVYASPDERFIAYAVEHPSPITTVPILAVGDRQREEVVALPDVYYIRDPYGGPDDFEVLWSADSRSFTLTNRFGRSGDTLLVTSLFVTGFASEPPDVQVQDWSESLVIAGQEYYSSEVHAIGLTGERVLIESNVGDLGTNEIFDNTHLILWNTQQPSDSLALTAIDTSHLIAATFHPTAPDKLLLVNERGLVEYDIHSRRMTVLNPAYHSGLGDYGLFSPDRAWLAIVEDGLEEGNYPPRLYVFDVRASLPAAE